MPKTTGTLVGAALAANAEAVPPGGNQNRHLPIKQLCGKLGLSAAIRVRPAIFDPDVLVLDVADHSQPLAEGTHPVGIRFRRSSRENSDHRHDSLLRMQGQRQCGRRPSHDGHEFSAIHSITSSARASSVVLR
jgi:hypothetical protein